MTRATVSSHDRLKQIFGKNKRIAKFVTTFGKAELSFKHRLAYSTLVFRDRDDRGLTLRKLSRLTGLHASRTLPVLLTDLAAHGLVEKVEQLWHGREPAGGVRDWFVYDPKATDWRKSLYYNYMVFPASVECPFSVMECAILVQFLLGTSSTALVAGRLKVSKKTVARTRVKLETVGGRLNGDWFQDKGPVLKGPRALPAVAAPAPSFVAVALPFLTPQQLELAETHSAMMQQAGYKEKYVLDIWQLVRRSLGQDGDRWYNFLWSFKEKFANTEARQKTRRKEGKGHWATSYELLRSDIPIICQRF